MCACSYMCSQAHVCAHVCRSQRKTSSVTPQTPTFFSESGSLVCLELAKQARTAGLSPRDPHLSASHPWDHSMKHDTQLFPLRFWGSSLHAPKATTLPTEPSIQPLFRTYKRQGWEVLLYTMWLYFLSLHLGPALTNVAVSQYFP